MEEDERHASAALSPRDPSDGQAVSNSTASCCAEYPKPFVTNLCGRCFRPSVSLGNCYASFDEWADYLAVRRKRETKKESSLIVK
jgi:hypothetical protein